MVGDEQKSKIQLIRELELKRQRIRELEALEKQHQETEKALRESERKSRAILDRTFQFIGLMQPDGTLIDANRTSLRFGGVEESAVLGKPFWETPWWSYSPELQKRLRKGVEKAAKGDFVRFEAAHKRPDGKFVCFDFSLKPVKDETGKVAFIIPEGRDITELKQAEEEVHRLALAIKHSGELVNMATLDGQMIFLNEAGGKILGINADEVEKTNIMEVIPAHHQELVKTDLLPTLLAGKVWKGDLQYRNLKTGILTDVHAVTYTVLDPETKEPLFLANVSMDMTDQKRAEKERHKLERQVQYVQKLESLGVLAGGIAHDFNNLLTGVLGNAELAAIKLPEDHPAISNLTGIESAASRAAELCKQMLAYSGKSSFAIELLDISMVVSDMAKMLEISISKKVSLTFNFDKPIHPIKADAAQIRQIILNLITNASEAIGDSSGDITLNIGSTQCDSSYFSQSVLNKDLPEGTYTYLEVTDSGEGMDEDTQVKVFDPFFTTKFTGRGLGLSAVLGIVRGHQGAVTISSTPGGGTTFRVLFPSATRTKDSDKREHQSLTNVRWSGTILLVDDEEPVRLVTSEMLRTDGFDVLTACDGREALDIFNANADKIVLVLLDLTMPNMDGEETFSALTQLKKDVRILLFSGYSEEDVSRRFADKKVAGFLQKPFTHQNLRQKIRQVLG